MLILNVGDAGRDIVSLNILFWRLVRAVAIEDPRKARDFYGVSERLAVMIAGMSLSDLDFLADIPVPAFRFQNMELIETQTANIMTLSHAECMQLHSTQRQLPENLSLMHTSFSRTYLACAREIARLDLQLAVTYMQLSAKALESLKRLSIYMLDALAINEGHRYAVRSPIVVERICEANAQSLPLHALHGMKMSLLSGPGPDGNRQS